MNKKLSTIPFFPFLLPIFFVLHGLAENKAYISFRDCLGLLGIYLLVTIVLYFLVYLFYRDHTRTALAVGALQGIFFFFGAIHDLFARYIVFLSRYSFLLPFLAVVLILLLIRLKKTGYKFGRVLFFVNLLFLIYIVVDAIRLMIPGPPDQRRLSIVNQNMLPPAVHTSAYPDVYLLLTDEYAGTASLRRWFGFDNSSLDSFLTDKGFHLLSGSRSNYNFTSFSMASMLNMSYLEGLGPGNTCTIADYADCNNLIRNSAVPGAFAMQGYDIVNYSIFDVGNQASEVNEPLLPVKTNLITGQTLWGRIRRDIGWHIYSLPFLPGWLKGQAYQVMDNNNRFIAGLKKISSTRSVRPRFVYAHLELPHSPFFYDKNGRLKEPKELEMGIQPYLDYIPYTNAVIKDLVTTIQKNTHDSAVILLMGDHGVRYDVPDGRDPDHIHYFQNQNAVFFPDRDYHLWYDSVSSVNQFRVVFSKIWGLSIPLLKDSAVFLTDKSF